MGDELAMSSFWPVGKRNRKRNSGRMAVAAELKQTIQKAEAAASEARLYW
jgi:hypothetical protein